MKQTPKEKKLFENFLPGKLTKEGFLGDDTRHIHDIIQADAKVLVQYQMKKETIARELKKLIHIGKQGLESEVETDDYAILVQWDRGMIACPFGEPGLHPKLIAKVKDKGSGVTIRYSQLCVHLVQHHGFFGGKGSAFRVDPEIVCPMLQRNLSSTQEK